MVNSERLPAGLAAAADALLDARGDAGKLRRIFDLSHVPMVMLDDAGRYVDINRPARLVAHRTLAEIRGRRLSELSAPEDRPAVEATWRRLRETSCVTGPYRRRRLDGTHVETVYFGLADAAPGRHVFAYVPADWPETELAPDDAERAPPSLSPRERQVLQLAAEGLSGPRIAAELTVSPATVKTHLANAYGKLGVSGRAAAVATALRSGVID